MIRDSDDGFDAGSVIFLIGVIGVIVCASLCVTGIVWSYQNRDQCDYEVEMADGTVYTDVKDVDNYTSGMTMIEFHHGPKVKVATAQIREVREV